MRNWIVIRFYLFSYFSSVLFNNRWINTHKCHKNVFNSRFTSVVQNLSSFLYTLLSICIILYYFIKINDLLQLNTQLTNSVHVFCKFFFLFSLFSLAFDDSNMVAHVLKIFHSYISIIHIFLKYKQQQQQQNYHHLQKKRCEGVFRCGLVLQMPLRSGWIEN